MGGTKKTNEYEKTNKMKNLKSISIYVVTVFLIFSSCNVGNNTPENITSTSETKTEINKYDLTSTTEKDALYALITNILEIKFDEKELEGVTFSRENYKTVFPEKLIEKINFIIPAGSSVETIIKENDNIEFSSISPHYESKITFKQDVILIAEKRFDENYENYQKFDLKSGDYVLNDKPNVIQSLFFTDGNGKYELIINGTKIKIIYQYLENEKMEPEIATLSNGKIIVGKTRLAFDGQKVDDVYKIRDNQLCVYNPETDSNDCYEFNRDLSNCNLDKFFK